MRKARKGENESCTKSFRVFPAFRGFKELKASMHGTIDCGFLGAHDPLTARRILYIYYPFIEKSEDMKPPFNGFEGKSAII